MRVNTQPPAGWEIVRLGEVAEVDTGGTPSRSQPEFWGGPIPWMASGEVNQRRVSGTAERITKQGLKNSNAKAFPPGTVMLAMNGQGATRGKTCVLYIEATCNQSLAAISSGPRSNNRFLFQVLDSAYERLRGLTGDGRNGLNLGLIRTFRFTLPPLPEQRAIAAVLDSIDEAIERTEAVIAAIERLRDALLHELLTRGVPGRHSKWKEVPGLGTIPASWEVVRLREVLKSTTYGTNEPLSTRGEMVVLRMNNLQNGELDLTEVRRADLSKKEVHELNLVPGDILFNRTNSLDLVGKVGVVRNLTELLSFASYLIRLRTVASRANSFWLSALLWSPHCQSRIRKFATPGVSQANINPTSLGSLTIPLPPLSEQEATTKLLDGVDVTLAAARREREGLQLFKESTADALLTGRVRVEGGERIHDQ